MKALVCLKYRRYARRTVLAYWRLRYKKPGSRGKIHSRNGIGYHVHRHYAVRGRDGISRDIEEVHESKAIAVTNTVYDRDRPLRLIGKYLRDNSSDVRIVL